MLTFTQPATRPLPTGPRVPTAGVVRPVVLIADHDPAIVQLLSNQLERDWFSVIVASNGAEALEIAGEQLPDLILLEQEIEGINGLEVCRAIRNDPRARQISVLLLSARDTEVDRVIGLEMGADDYIVKPFAIREVLARVRAAIRRRDLYQPSVARAQHGRLLLDFERCAVTLDGQPVPLTPTEFRLLSFLSQRSPRVVSRDDIIERALGGDASVLERAVDVHVSTLRKKLRHQGDLIETVRGFGYRLADRQQVASACA